MLIKSQGNHHLITESCTKCLQFKKKQLTILTEYCLICRLSQKSTHKKSLKLNQPTRVYTLIRKAENIWRTLITVWTTWSVDQDWRKVSDLKNWQHLMTYEKAMNETEKETCVWAYESLMVLLWRFPIHMETNTHMFRAVTTIIYFEYDCICRYRESNPNKRSKIHGH